MSGHKARMNMIRLVQYTALIASIYHFVEGNLTSGALLLMMALSIERMAVKFLVYSCSSDFESFRLRQKTHREGFSYLSQSVPNAFQFFSAASKMLIDKISGNNNEPELPLYSQ